MMSDKIYISDKDLTSVYNFFNGDATFNVVRDIMSRYSGPQLEALKKFCLSKKAVSDINKEIGKLDRERISYQDTIDKLGDTIVIGDEFDDILPDEKGAM